MSGPIGPSGTSVILVGAGRFAEETTDVAADAGVEVVAWIEGLDAGLADPAHDPPILWVGDQAAFRPDIPVLPAIGSVRRRGLVERLVAEGRSLATLVHPSAVIARTAVLEPGCVVFAGVVIGARTRVGSGTIVDRGALIGHHTTIGAHSFIGPGATIAGGVEIGEEVRIGIGSIVRDDRRIGARATVGAGAVVVADVQAGVTVIGLPARPMERT
ncbi:MAG: acetyltransferase [Candidatus Limnocylindrales bacterium]